MKEYEERGKVLGIRKKVENRKLQRGLDKLEEEAKQERQASKDRRETG